MSSLGTYLAAGAALGAASEATGATNFTPLGQQARQADQGAGPAAPSIDLDLGGAADGGVNADVLEQLADSVQQQQSGPSALEIARVMQEAGGSDGGAAAALRAELDRQRERAERFRDEARERAEKRDVDGDGESEFTVPDWVNELRPDREDEGGAPDDDSSSDGDDFKLQDLEGRGPFGIGTGIAAGGEAGAATGETVDKSVGGLSKVGNTGAQTLRALSGKEYSAEDTLAEDIHGTETRRIDWDDYNPFGGDDSSNESRTSKNNDEDAKRNRDESPPDTTLVEMTPGAEYLPGVEAPDRSDSSDDSSESSGDLGVRTEAAIEKLKRGETASIGGL